MKDTFPLNSSLGAVFSEKDLRDYRIASVEKLFPDTFKLNICEVKNQGSVCSCVAHALAETIEYHNALAGVNDAMSTGYIYGNRRESVNKGKGMIVRDALKMACKYGDIARIEFPVNVEVPKAIDLFEEIADKYFEEGSKSRFEKYYRVTTEEEIKTALMNDGPVVFAIAWYSDFKVNKDGILESTYSLSNKGGGHCMIIYGWDENGWLIRNSWGLLWGKGGNAILPYDAPIREAWGIADDKSNTPIKKPYNTRIGKFFATIFNAILRFVFKLFNV